MQRKGKPQYLNLITQNNSESDSPITPSPALSPLSSAVPNNLSITTQFGLDEKTLYRNFTIAFTEPFKVIIYSPDKGPRKAVMSVEDECICWNFSKLLDALKKGTRTMPFKDIKQVTRGKYQTAFRKKDADAVPEDKCLIVESNNKIIAIQLGSSIQRDVFADGLDLYMKLKK